MTYNEIFGLDPKVSMHDLGIKHRPRPIEESQRVLHSDLIPRTETKVDKFIDAGFINEVKSNVDSGIVPIKKMNGQIRIYVDFRDLNNACPKDDFPLPISSNS
ncbi:hypothetical protein Sango_1749000 [Sesamum angolense]|uniref:Uncharacterized protein n=1 Tax=Sesamum angolense TaxID=2727404 RepID=A0AAE1WM41_9LAMI|nr:hypothetical protein Sango_1749000 [Sesamum angolense]